jgi:hypothetical protein
MALIPWKLHGGRRDLPAAPLDRIQQVKDKPV